LKDTAACSKGRNKLSNKNKGYIFIITASILFAMIGIFGKLAMQTGIGPFELLVYQYALMAALSGAWLAAARPRSLRVPRRDLVHMVIQGLIGTGGTTILYYLALDRINVGIASMLLFTYPVFVNVFFMASGIRAITRIGKWALGIAFAGSLLVLDVLNIGLAGLSAAGVVFGLLSSICYAFYNTYADLKLSSVPPAVICFYTSLAAMTEGLILMPSIVASPPAVDVELVLYLIMLSVVSGILPVLLIYRGIAWIGADKASIVSCSELPLTIILAYFALGEQMNMLQLVGVALVIAAVLLLHRSDGADGIGTGAEDIEA